MLAPNPTAPTEAPPKWYDVTVVTKKTYERACVESVPPEEVGIDKNARSITDCGYFFHESAQRQDKLIADGYDYDCINRLPGYIDTTSLESQSRDTVEESEDGGGDTSSERATRLVKVTEHYVRMDYKGDGKPCLYCVTTGGDDSTILTRDGDLAVEEIEFIPFASMTAVPVPHRFFGRSIADLVMDIQRIKTALMRGMLDNVYAVTRPRPVVDDSRSNENTMDDLLASEHGKPIRVRQEAAAAIVWQQVPDITPSLYPAIQYMDATREWRTGVTRQGQGIDPNALQNQVATIANQMHAAAQAKVKLIARVFAETGIKDLFSLLHATIRKNGSKAQTVRLRNKWVNVDPRDWKERNDLTINVGLGTGGKQELFAQIMNVLAVQEKAVAAGFTNLVGPEQLYNSAKELTKLAGFKDDRFFTNPQGQPPPPPKQDPKIIELQMKNEIEKTQAQADVAVNDRKVQADIALNERKFQLERELKEMEMRMKALEHQAKMQENAQKHAADMRSVEVKHSAEVSKHQMGLQQKSAEMAQGDQEAQHNEREREQVAKHKERERKLLLAASGIKALKNAEGDEDYVAADDDRTEKSNKSIAELAEAIKEMVKASLAPTEIVRDPKTGRAVGARKSLN